MNVIEYTSPNYPGKIFTQEYDMDDLIEGIDEFDRETVKKICTDFLDMMVKSLIDDNDYFLFPVRNFAFIHIYDTCNDSNPDYRYDVINGRRAYFNPVIRGTKTGKRYLEKRYLMKFIGKTKEHFESELEKCHHY